MVRSVPVLFWWTVGGISGLTFISLALLAGSHQPLPGDLAALQWIRGWDSPPLTQGMRAITLLGEARVLLPVVLLVGLTLWRHWRTFAIAQCGLIAAAPIFEWLMKQWVGRPRPEGASLGFPSGHALAAAVAYGLLAYLLWRRMTRAGARWAVIAFLVVVVAAVGISRIYLHAHWPSDVVGGVTGGLAYLVPALAWLDRGRGPSGAHSKE